MNDARQRLWEEHKGRAAYLYDDDGFAADLADVILTGSPDTWDDDAAHTSIAVAYVTTLHRRLVAQLRAWHLSPPTSIPEGLTPESSIEDLTVGIIVAHVRHLEETLREYGLSLERYLPEDTE